MSAVVWEAVRHFSKGEFVCSCGCDSEHMDFQFITRLDNFRRDLGFPLIVTSGYRCPEYNDKISGTGKTGPHTTGKAADVAVSYHRARNALALGLQTFKGVGAKQHGSSAGRFLHLDDVLHRPFWTYT